MSLLLCLGILTGLYVRRIDGITPTLQQFPNPVDNPWCRRSSSSSSSSAQEPTSSLDRLCDPDEYLTYESAANIQMLTMKIGKEIPHTCSTTGQHQVTGYEIVTIVTQTLPSSTTHTTPEQVTKYLHDRWGVGNINCHNGIVIFLAIQDRQIYISTGKDSKEKLTDDIITMIINDMKPDLRAQKYGDGIMKALMHIHDILQGGTFTSFHSSFGSRGKTGSDDFIMFIFMVLIFNGFLIVGCVMNHKQNQRIRREQDEWNEVRRRLLEIERLQEEEQLLDTATDGGNDTVITDPVSGQTHLRKRRPLMNNNETNDSNEEDNSSFIGSGSTISKVVPLTARMTCCPICLEDFPKKSSKESNDNSNDTNEEKKELLLTVEIGTSSTGSTVTSGPNAATETKPAITLPCQHRFHVTCIDGWFGSQQKTTCPVCRSVAYGPNSGSRTSSRRNPSSSSTTISTTTTTTTTTTGLRPFSSPDTSTENRNNKESHSSSSAVETPTTTILRNPTVVPDNYNHYLFRRLEIEFLLYSLSRRYPTVVTPTLLDSWTNQIQRTPSTTGTAPSILRFTQTDTFRQSNPQVREAALRQYQQRQMQNWNGGSQWSGGGFGGGGSFGGGGRGGSW